MAIFAHLFTQGPNMAVVGLCQISLNYSLKQKLFTNRGIVITNKCALLCPMSFCPNIVRYCVPYFPRKKLQLCICPYCAYFPFVLMFRLCIRPFCAYVPLCINMSLLCICPLSLCPTKMSQLSKRWPEATTACEFT